MKNNTSKTKGKRGRRGAGYLFKRGANYWLEYKIDGERVRTPLHDPDGNHITTKPEAEAARSLVVAPLLAADKQEAQRQILARLKDADQEAEDAKENARVAAAQGVTIEGAWRTYSETARRTDRRTGQPIKRLPAPQTESGYEGHYNNFASWAAEHHPNVIALRDVDEAMGDAYAATLRGAKSGGTFNKHLNTLTRVWDTLKDKAACRVNPWVGIPREHSEQNGRDELTLGQLVKIERAAVGEMNTLIRLGVYTGMRLADCATLQWDSVDLRRNRIQVHPRKTKGRTGALVTIELHPELAHTLQELPRPKRQRYVLPAMADRYSKNQQTEITNAFRNLVIECGIDTHAEGTGSRIVRDEDGEPERDEKGRVVTERQKKRAVVKVGFHSLRHTFVSMCAERNVPMSVMQLLVGHGSPAITRSYIHMGEDATRSAIQSLPALTESTTAKRDPIPGWALELLDTMTAKNWKQIRNELKGAK